MTLLEQADQFPPILCRYLARKKHGYHPMSVRDIAAASGLSKSKVAELSDRTSWRGIAIEDVVAFSLACGVDLQRPSRVMEYIRRSKRVYLARANPQQREFLARIFKLRGSARSAEQT